jgi:hypothetical protein
MTKPEIRINDEARMTDGFSSFVASDLTRISGLVIREFVPRANNPREVSP